MDHLPGLHRFGGPQDFPKDRQVRYDLIVRHTDDYKPNSEFTEIVLVLQFSVDSDENIEQLLSMGQ